jgi:hypothetical protein
MEVGYGQKSDIYIYIYIYIYRIIILFYFCELKSSRIRDVAVD